jgi:hypothetical protein
MRHQIPVSLLEFDDDGHTLWVHGPEGNTILRIKGSRGIDVQKGNEYSPYIDVYVEGKLNINLPGVNDLMIHPIP